MHWSHTRALATIARQRNAELDAALDDALHRENLRDDVSCQTCLQSGEGCRCRQRHNRPGPLRGAPPETGKKKGAATPPPPVAIAPRSKTEGLSYLAARNAYEIYQSESVRRALAEMELLICPLCGDEWHGFADPAPLCALDHPEVEMVRPALVKASRDQWLLRDLLRAGR